MSRSVPARAALTPTTPGPPTGRERPRPEVVAHRDPTEAQRRPQLAGGDAPREGGGVDRVESRIHRRAEHDHRHAVRDQRREGTQVDAAQDGRRERDADGALVRVHRGGAQAGEVLWGGGDVGLGEPGREGHRHPRHPCRRAARDATLGDQRGTRPADVGDRRQIHVGAHRAQQPPGRAPRGARDDGPGGAQLGARLGRGAPQAPHRAALLVDHHQQGLVERGRAGDRLQTGRPARARRPSRGRSSRAGSRPPPRRAGFWPPVPAGGWCPGSRRRPSGPRAGPG